MSEIPRCATCNHRLTEHGKDACTVQECACLFYMPQETERSDVHWLRWALERSGASVTLSRAECLVLLGELGAETSPPVRGDG